jgi:DNA-binding NarL/FixJ family response regulator
MIRILLADDQTLVRQGIRGLLELSGAIEVVAEAEDGDGALAAIRVHRPDIALLDVRMPKKSGVEVVCAMRADGDRTPVILLTTFDDDAVLREGLRAGIAGYLLKDVDSQQLVSSLMHVAGGGTLIVPTASVRAQAYVRERGLEFDAAELPDPLTPREVEVLQLIARGYSNREIAEMLGTVEGTVKNQASSILSKLGVRDRTRAVLKALELGWLIPNS